MVDLTARLQKIVEEISGNESLLEMLETEAATEMLNWGASLAATLVKRTEEMDDIAADLAILPRLKAVRQSMRSIGNWAAGKYADPESRIRLRDKLLEHFRVIFGEGANLPAPPELDSVLNEVDDTDKTPHQLILELKQLLQHLI